MASQTGTQTIAISILTDISKGKSNQTMKVGQLTEHEVQNIFCQKSLRN